THPKMNKSRAVFLDRDGVLNRLVCQRRTGIIDSPFTARQFELLPGAGAAVKRLNKLGLKTVVVSNQPGIAKGNFTAAVLDAKTRKLERALGRQGARLDGIYYCLHHPQAASPKYRKRCRCRKPKPGLLQLAARALDVDLRRSFMVGDNLTDVEAGKSAGCTTIFIGDWKCDWCRFMKAKNRTPDHIVPDLPAASRLISKIVAGTV
ncbi:MAG: HAD family hydrolase, partial [candidate division WOR-3 bacterium]